MKNMYLVAIRGSHGPELTSGRNCLFEDWKLADQLVKYYHAKGMKYMKVFMLEVTEELPVFARPKEGG